MERNVTSGECNENSQPSLRGIQEAMGLQRFDVRQIIEELRANPYANVDAPEKALNTALEALLIEDIWKNVRQWITDHPECRGLADTNVPPLAPVYSAIGSARETRTIPRDPNEIEMYPLSREVYLEMEELFSYKEHMRWHPGETYTRNVLQAHLLKWELEQHQARPEKTNVNDLYNRYCTEISLQDSSFTAFLNPATRKMYAGFTFGQSVYWSLPEEAHKALVPKLGQIHMSLIADVSNDTQVFSETPMSGDHSNLSSGYLDQLMHKSDRLGQQQRIREQDHGASMSKFITGCPAFYTDAFGEIGQWVRDIRGDLRQA